jgi:hypothetical protein
MKVFKESKYIHKGFWLAITVYDPATHYEQCTAYTVLAYNIYNKSDRVGEIFQESIHEKGYIL